MSLILVDSGRSGAMSRIIVGKFLKLSGFGGLDPGPKNFGNAPGLGDAASGRERSFGVKDLADRAQPASLR